MQRLPVLRINTFAAVIDVRVRHQIGCRPISNCRLAQPNRLGTCDYWLGRDNADRSSGLSADDEDRRTLKTAEVMASLIKNAQPVRGATAARSPKK